MAILCLSKILSVGISGLNCKLPQIPHMTSYPNYKDTLFYPTFKIEENKVPLFFGLEVKWMGYSHFEFGKIMSFGVSGLSHKMAIDPSNEL